MKHIHLWGVSQNNLKNIDIKIPLGSFTVICGPSGSGKSSLAFETLYAEGQRRYIESLSNYAKQFLNKAPKPILEGVENIPPSIAIEQKNSVKSSRSSVGTATEIIDYLRILYEKLGKAYCPHHHILVSKDSIIDGVKKILNTFEGERGYILCPIQEGDRLLDSKKFLDHLLREGFLRIYCPSKESALPNDSDELALGSVGSKKKSKSLLKKKTKKKKVVKKKRAIGTEKKKSTKKILAQAKKSSKVRDELKVFSMEEPMGEILDLTELKAKKKGVPSKTFYLVIDRLGFQKNEKGRVQDSLAQAYHHSTSLNSHMLYRQAMILTTTGRRLFLSEAFSCSVCDYRFPEITTDLFSFNTPVGACSHCKGFGNVLSIDTNKVVPKPGLTLSQGAIKPFTMPSAAKARRQMLLFCREMGIDEHTPWRELTKKEQDLIWKGNKKLKYKGVDGFFAHLETKKYKMHVRVFLARHKSPTPCPVCEGSRLVKEAQQVLVKEQSISDLTAMTIEDLLQWFEKLKLNKHDMEICKEPLTQVKSRLSFLIKVGVAYLTLDRPTKTLSGGEFQRLTLSNQLGLGLSQTLYVLDEPTIGLHPRDNQRLIEVLKNLNDLGNTLVVVEHDHDVIKSSDNIIEMGPGSGHLGGEVLFSGSQKEFYRCEASNTTPFLKPRAQSLVVGQGRPTNKESHKYKLEIFGCEGNNLKSVDLTLPLNRVVTITGVSGSGKSTLVSHTLYPALARLMGHEVTQKYEYQSLSGARQIKDVLYIDQSAVGKTARSMPVTYLKVFDAIRYVLAASSEGRARGYTPGTFSLNVDGGRCPVCKGLGYEVIDMVFMDDIEILCDGCDGKKYRSEVLDITYKGKNVYEILKLTVAQAMNFFVSYPNIRRPLSFLKEVGLEYLTLGQSARSLSGGESQRLKVAKEFNSTNQKATLYILDEPTSGLHFREVQLLMKMLNRLVDAGGSVVLVEHNLEVILNSDYVIDMGPEAGEQGGEIVAEGTPLDLMSCKRGFTGKYLNEYVHTYYFSTKAKR